MNITVKETGEDLGKVISNRSMTFAETMELMGFEWKDTGSDCGWTNDDANYYDEDDLEFTEDTACEYRADLCSNNAYTSVVIYHNGKISLAAQIDKEIFNGFLSKEPDFGNWGFGGPYDLTIRDDTDTDTDFILADYGDVFAFQCDNGEIKVIDEDLFNDMLDFFGIKGK